MPADDVQLPDLEVIQRFSLAVRGVTAPRAEVVAALQADLAWLTGEGAAPTAAPAPAPAPAAAPAAAPAPAPAPARAPRKTAPPPRKRAARRPVPTSASTDPQDRSRTDPPADPSTDAPADTRA